MLVGCYGRLSCDCLAHHAGGEPKPLQDGQEAAEPKDGPSETTKAQKKRAKKARQRASRAQPVAQTNEVMQLIIAVITSLT